MDKEACIEGVRVLLRSSNLVGFVVSKTFGSVFSPSGNTFLVIFFHLVI